MKLFRRVFASVLLLFVVVLCACAKKPTMKVHHAEVQGVQVGFPPSLTIQMTVVLDVSKDEVRIGEEGNLVRLTKEAWNTLVEKIKAGELRAL